MPHLCLREASFVLVSLLHKRWCLLSPPHPDGDKERDHSH